MSVNLAKSEIKALEESRSGIRLGKSSGFFGAMRYATPEKWEYIVKFPGLTMYQKYQEYIAHVSKVACTFSDLDYELSEKGIRSVVTKEVVSRGIISSVEYYYGVARAVSGCVDYEKLRFPTVQKIEAMIPVLREISETYTKPDGVNLTKISAELSTRNTFKTTGEVGLYRLVRSSAERSCRKIPR